MTDAPDEHDPRNGLALVLIVIAAAATIQGVRTWQDADEAARQSNAFLAGVSAARAVRADHTPSTIWLAVAAVAALAAVILWSGARRA